ncbi:MAG: GNAT family N-acetyltransferase [Candidatus Thiodiazotropha sp. (ex Monitilora ramsayi)]|nr:GNAT family N-acetyltransferase [Candidatus Thiodiazotropha sp. (ex Monitilora ramsayi)]
MDGELRITVQRGIEGLEKIRDIWADLYQQISQPAYYQDWRWMYLLVKWLIKHPIYFAVLYKHDKAVLILPLQSSVVSHPGINQTVLCFPTHNHIVLSDALVDDNKVEIEDFHYFLEYVKKKSIEWNTLSLSNVCEDSEFYKLCRLSDFYISPTSFNAYFHCPKGKLDESLSKKFIKNIKRLGRRAEKDIGSVEASFIHQPEDIDSAFSAFLELESSGWKGVNGTSTAIAHHEELVSFYSELAKSFADDGSFQVNLLRIGGIPAAAQFCIRVRCVWYVLKVAYNDKMKSYGAGNLLMLSFLEYVSADPSVTEVNLVTSPDWADRWHLNKRPVYTMQFFNGNIKGHLCEVYFNAKSKMKALMK